MIYAGFCGPSNPSQSLLADGERLVNWYVERISQQFAPTEAALYPTPGQSAYITTSDVGVRAIMSEINGRAFAVVGTSFRELFATRTSTIRGTVAQNQYPATISYNGRSGNQLLIVSGGNAYCYDLTTNILTQVLTGEATMGGMINSRFLAFNLNNGRVRMSDLNNGLTWNPLLFFERSIAPDPWQAMIVGSNEIWMVGEQTGEIWQDTGAFPQPFAPSSGAFFQYGILAPFAWYVAGDQIGWLSKTKLGQGQIVSARGTVPIPISNYAVETAIATYARNGSISDAEALAYQQDGHTFAVFSFPNARGTWAVDLDTSDWHERGSWDAANNRYDAWKPRVHGYAFNRHLVGERGTGTISEMDISFGSDNGNVIRRLRIGPPLWVKDSQRLTVSRLGLMMDTGIGLSAGQGSDPQVMLRASYDARTWGPQRQASAGLQGQYGRRVYFTRCGSSLKCWVPEITVTDPVTAWRILGAEVDGTGIYQLQRAA